MTSIKLSRSQLKTLTSDNKQMVMARNRSKSPRSKSPGHKKGKVKFVKQLQGKGLLSMEHYRLHATLAALRPLVPQLKIKRQALAIAKDGYLTDQKTDLKSLQKEYDLLQQEIDILKNSFRGTGKLDTMHYVLTKTTTSTSSATSTQAPSVGVTPGDSAEFSSLAILFDEVICDSVDLYWDLAVANSNTADMHAAVAYDPINSGNYTSVVTVLEASQFHGPVHVCNNARNMQPLNHTPTGMWHKHFMMPKGSEVRDPVTPSVLATGQWTSTGVSTSVYGYCKWFVEAPSAALTSVVTSFMRMHCRFRSRS